MTKTDTLVIGAGPSGIQLGYHLQKAGRDYLILERGEPAEFFKKHPRHRKLISINKVYTGYDDPERNMRWDWNSLLTDDHSHLFKDYTKAYFPHADLLVKYFQDYAKKYQVKIRTGVNVTRVSRNADGFLVDTRESGQFQAKHLVVATGNAKPNIPNIKGIELAEQYESMSVDPNDFINQRVLVLGKANSGFETADNLVEVASLIHIASPTPVQLAWHTRWVGHLRAVNNNLLDTYHLKLQNALLDAEIRELKRLPNGRIAAQVAYNHAGGEIEVIEYDRVLCATGWRFDESIFDPSCKPEIGETGRFPAMTSAWESSNIPGLYFAGALTQSRDFHKCNSAFIHGFRYNTRALFHILEERNHGVPLPNQQMAGDGATIGAHIIERLKHTSALWQQFAFMCDAYVVEGGRARALPEVTVDYVKEHLLTENNDAFLLTLEFGDYTGDPFAIDRNSDYRRAELSVFLHPVVRHYSKGKLVGTHHIYENLFAEWEDNVLHRDPLMEFVDRSLGREPRSAAVA